MSDREAPSLRARTRLLEDLRDAQKRLQRLTTSGVESDAASDAADPSVVQLLRACPPLTDPTWAMEELLRVNPNIGVWTGSHLSPAVWAPPWSGNCPFRTTESDFSSVYTAFIAPMRLLVKCSIGVPADGSKELVIRNPTATLSNLRAAIAINFRLPVHSFRMVHGATDLSDEKQPLDGSGVKEGDVITVVSKRDRDENKAEAETSDAPVPTEKFAAETGEKNAAAEPKEKEKEKDEEEAEAVEEDEEEDDDEGGAADGATELLSHLLATVPNIVEMRRQFLENPAEIMQQIQQRDPHLFELITANHQEFLELVGNEALIETLQLEQEASDEEDEDFEDEEDAMDEESEEALQRMLAQYLVGGADGGGNEGADGENAESEAQRYLLREPSAEDEEKIEQLMQLGFTRDQCKVAYFKANRGLERAANILFEDPPQL